MSESTERLRRLIEDEEGACCDGDLERRLTELDDIEERAGARPEDVEVFAALADDTRFRLVRLLAAADERLCVCELGPLVDVSESGLSHALATLREAGLVEREKEGRWHYYGTTDLASGLLAALDDGRAAASEQ